MALLTTKQAAEKLGVTAIRVRQLIAEGKIEAEQVGRDWIIQESALTSVTVYGKAGRPSKSESTAAETKSRTPATKPKKKAK